MLPPMTIMLLLSIYCMKVNGAVDNDIDASDAGADTGDEDADAESALLTIYRKKGQ